MRPKRSQANSVRELGDLHATDNQRAATDRPQAVRDEQNAAKTNPLAPLGWTRDTDARIVEDPEWLPHSATGLAIGGIPAVLVAAFIVKSMPVTALRWLVVAVVLYAAMVMLRAAMMGRREPLSPLEERAEAI